ncbi:MAG: hypothetical protein JEY96_19680 [Bacteroidales bacterium]|nr:hypothetical protein [Bacteroidales bacterium]
MKIKKCSRKIEKISVVISPSREAATTLIANKHTINLRKPWKPLRQAYFYKSQLDNGKTIKELMSEYPEHDILKFIKMLEVHKMAKSVSYENESIEKLVHDERKFPITNLERMYSDPDVRKFLGFDFDDKGEIKGKIKLSEFNKGIKNVVEDVATGSIDSRKYNTGKQRALYLERFPLEKKPDLSKKGNFTSKDVKEISIKDKREQFNDTAQSRSNKIPKSIFSPGKIPIKINNSSLRILYNELKDLPVSKYPNAIHDLLRSFLECSLVVFLKQKGEYDSIQKNNKHNPTLSEMLNHLKSDKCNLITDTNLRQLIQQIVSQYSEKYSLERMNMIQHNENWGSSESEVRIAWAKLEPLMKILLNPDKL